MRLPISDWASYVHMTDWAIKWKSTQLKTVRIIVQNMDKLVPRHSIDNPLEQSVDFNPSIIKVQVQILLTCIVAIAQEISKSCSDTFRLLRINMSGCLPGIRTHDALVDEHSSNTLESAKEDTKAESRKQVQQESSLS